MADIGPDDLPFVPDASISLINMTPDPSTGKLKGTPTQGFHDWLSDLWSKMKGTLVDLTTKVTTLTASIGDLSAAITTEATIRQTQDGILASQITTVDAKANNATASGQVYLAARAAPSGAVAAYGWNLTAGSAYAGMQAIALSGGGSAIAFSANQFMFYDSGTAQQILAYSGGYYTFNANVKINGNLSIENGTVTVNNIALGAVGFNGAYAYGTTVELGLSGSTAWNDYAAASLSPQKMGAGTFFFTYVGTAGSAYANGTVTLEFRIVRRKSGVDTVMYGPVQYSGTGVTASGFEHWRWFSDTSGAGPVQYVCQFRFVSQTGSNATGATSMRQANYFRIDWQGADT